MMDQWSYNGEGGGYFNETTTPGQSGSKSAAREQFLCPATVRQLLEASADGLKVGSLTATMISITGVVSGIHNSATNIKFCLSDDTGSINCLEWLESEDDVRTKGPSNMIENTYYHVIGCIKPQQNGQKMMVFKTIPVKNFNEITAFLLEVMNVSEYAEKVSKMPKQSTTETSEPNSYNPYGNFGYDDNKTAFTPIQKAVFDAIKAVGTQVGWSRHDPQLKKMFSVKQIQDALDFLVGEGHIYTTVDDDHFCST